MGILPNFEKQTYTLYEVTRSAFFMDQYDHENTFRLEYQSMRIHENKYKGWGEDYEDLPNREIVKISTDIKALIKIANQFNNLQEKYLYDKVYPRINVFNHLSPESDHPFPIELEDLYV